MSNFNTNPHIAAQSEEAIKILDFLTIKNFREDDLEGICRKGCGYTVSS